MAEKGFGVKEVNLIGASGTPTITSPNNLNLNAVNVAISTNATVGGTLSVTGNVSVGGTLTYEDVTNIDSVGLITARSGVVVGAGKSILVGAGVTISSSTKGDIQISGIATAQKFDAPYTGAGSGFSMEGGAYNNGYYINNGSGNTLIGMAYYSNNTIGLGGNGSSTLAFKIDDVTSINLSPKTGATTLDYAESTKLATTNTGVTVTGTLAATAVTGDGSGLTGISVTPTNSDIQVVYTVTANGSSAYRFAGNGVVSTADDPDLYLIRGQKYRFINNSGGSHPFQIREASGGTAYSTGVTNNGAASGNIDFAPTFASPAQLVYQCTSHSGMVGNIYLRDAAGGNTNVGVTTFSGSVIVADTSAFTADTGADDLIVGSTNSGINRGITILNHTGQDGRLCFGQSGDPDAGMIKYSHGSDILQFFVESSEKLRIDSNGDLGLGIAAVPQDSGARTLHIHDTTTGSAARAAIRLTHGSSGSSASNGAFLGFDNNPDFYIYNQESGKLRFGTAGTERYRITSDGKHQFGKPGAFQSDVDEDDFAFTFSSNAAATHPNTNNRDTDFVEAMQIVGPVRDNTNTPALVITEMGGQATGRQSLMFWNGDYNSGAGYIKSRIYTQVGASYNSTQFYIDVADSSKSPQQRFRIDTSGNFHGSSSNNISDQRLKKDIATITDPLTKIKGLTGRTFKWKEDSTKFDDKTKFGFIAQEVETILPELVNSDGLMHFDANDNICDEFEAISHSKSVVETGVIPITVEAIKTLIAKVETLEAEVAALKAK